MAEAAWKPWHEVVKPGEDARKGELPLATFAADEMERLSVLSPRTAEFSARRIPVSQDGGEGPAKVTLMGPDRVCQTRDREDSRPS